MGGQKISKTEISQIDNVPSFILSPWSASNNRVKSNLNNLCCLLKTYDLYEVDNKQRRRILNLPVKIWKVELDYAFRGFKRICKHKKVSICSKVLSLLEACFNLISSPSPSMKIQIMSWKITEYLGFKSLLLKVKIFCPFSIHFQILHEKLHMFVF